MVEERSNSAGRAEAVVGVDVPLVAERPLPAPSVSALAGGQVRGARCCATGAACLYGDGHRDVATCRELTMNDWPVTRVLRRDAVRRRS